VSPPAGSRHYIDRVNAEPFLAEIARALHTLRFDAVLIGNAAAALQGAPVTTLDFDFMFRKTSTNLRKLKALARELRATVLRPYYPASDMFFRMTRDDDGLQLDFMATIHGVKSYAGLRDRASIVEIGGAPLRVASLADIIRSKKAANRPRDVAVIELLEKTYEEAAVARDETGRARARKRTRTA
jgi:predicted nucleotidyltransferase